MTVKQRLLNVEEQISDVMSLLEKIANSQGAQQPSHTGPSVTSEDGAVDTKQLPPADPKQSTHTPQTCVYTMKAPQNVHTSDSPIFHLQMDDSTSEIEESNA